MGHGAALGSAAGAGRSGLPAGADRVRDRRATRRRGPAAGGGDRGHRHHRRLPGRPRRRRGGLRRGGELRRAGALRPRVHDAPHALVDPAAVRPPRRGRGGARPGGPRAPAGRAAPGDHRRRARRRGHGAAAHRRDRGRGHRVPRSVSPLWLRLRAQAAAVDGDPARCAAVRADLAPHRGQWAAALFGCDIVGPVDLWLGGVDAAEGRWDEAVDCYTAARDAADRLGARPWSVLARPPWWARSSGATGRATRPRRGGCGPRRWPGHGRWG
ncbi:hypothetical protein V2I01_20910 [Micromonospora sp. BRA006-A]|nr:hypothetical protein [Micromonospora sp. BRA006-A]